MVSARLRGRLIFWGLVAVAALLVVAMAVRQQPVWVDVSTASRGPLEVVIVEEGRTRVQDRYTVSTPVAGYMRRLPLKVGDRVSQGDRLATLEPLRSDVLDARSRAEARARVAAAQAALEAARQRVLAAEADDELARAELARHETLAVRDLVSREMLEQVRAQARRAEAALRSARFAVDVAQHESEAARTRLSFAGAADGGAELVAVSAPVSGAVLQVMRESEGAIAAGQPLLEIGDTAALEVVVEVQSFDAVRLRPGMETRLTRWGGEPLPGRVRHIEPVGFTEISALGVEEQRVRVVVDILAPHEAWQNLGDGYRVDAHFILWRAADILRVPRAAVFAHEGGEAVFVIEGDRAVLRPVRTGHGDGFMSEVLEGLDAGEVVVRHPGNELEDGAPVRTRL